jgi:hypothetical protein
VFYHAGNHGQGSVDAGKPDLSLLRQVILRRLRDQPGWNQLEEKAVTAYRPYLELSGAEEVLNRSVLKVFYELVNEGVLSPGINCSNMMCHFPWFQVTDYGRELLAARDYVPHDKVGYLQLLHDHVPAPDSTVLVYLAKSLETFLRGNFIASTVMLGVAAERVFNLVCDSLEPALASAKEREKLAALQRKRSIKGRADWVHDKLRAVQDGKPHGFPENAAIMATGIYDMIRTQRNDLGHPRETPPRLTRRQVNANLVLFPTFYETAESVRTYLTSSNV